MSAGRDDSYRARKLQSAMEQRVPVSITSIVGGRER
jgi:hypothetical protein